MVSCFLVLVLRPSLFVVRWLLFVACLLLAVCCSWLIVRVRCCSLVVSCCASSIVRGLFMLHVLLFVYCCVGVCCVMFVSLCC